MNLPWTVWAPLACGVMWNASPQSWRVAWASAAISAVIWSLLVWTVVPDGIVPAGELDSLAQSGILLALVWSVGFLKGMTDVAGPAAVWLTIGGLCAVGCGQDWLTVGLGWEIVRIATVLPAASRTDRGLELARLPSLGLWTAIVTWLFATGSLEFHEIAVVLQRSYVAHDPEVSLGRPALILAGAACLTVIAALTPCFSILRFATAEQTGDARIAAWCARQLAGVLFLARCCGTVFVGLEEPAMWVLLVLAAVAWVLAVRLVAQPSRLERLWTGCACWQLAIVLTWLALLLAERTSIPGGLPAARGLGFIGSNLMAELLHTTIALVGMTAAVRLLSRSGASPVFLEDLRGVARERPLWSALLLVPLASLMGLPIVWGGWQRFLLLVSLWSVLQAGPNDTLTPHHGLLVLELSGLAACIMLAGFTLTVFRTLLWEHSLTAWNLRRDGWSWAIAATATMMLATAIFWLDKALSLAS